MLITAYLKKRSSNNTNDKIKRSFVKSVSWRLIGTLDTILLTWIVTGKVSMAITVGSFELITKMLLYFFHERLWNKINWGK